jgi:hypothetical protein
MADRTRLLVILQACSMRLPHFKRRGIGRDREEVIMAVLNSDGFVDIITHSRDWSNADTLCWIQW